jgi:hypothetical protein
LFSAAICVVGLGHSHIQPGQIPRPQLGRGGSVIATLGILVLVWPGISILVSATLFAVYLLVSTLSPRFPAPARHGRGQADQA